MFLELPVAENRQIATNTMYAAKEVPDELDIFDSDEENQAQESDPGSKGNLIRISDTV